MYVCMCASQRVPTLEGLVGLERNLVAIAESSLKQRKQTACIYVPFQDEPQGKSQQQQQTRSRRDASFDSLLSHAHPLPSRSPITAF